jgi:acetylornithine deacetylase/succinyl-diaminopimelate desuccinylase-like protein
VDFTRLQTFIDTTWSAEVMAPLIEYVAIPCESPAFDPAWAEHGHMDRAVALLAGWTRDKLADVTGATVEVLSLPARTPAVFIDVPGGPGPPVLIYGHLDKQPPMAGWLNGRGAWTPVIEGDRLYGRGGADDGYSIFSAVLAILALREQGLAHPRCMILIEACEESGSHDLPFYVDLLAARMGAPAIVVALDSGCGNYDQLWVTTSLRGQVAGVLSVRVMTEAVHSGEASGIVPSSFRIATRLLARLEDPDTGEIVAPQFRVEIPPQRRAEALVSGAALGSGVYDRLPFVEGAGPVTQDVTELALNRAWRPQLAITGIDGLPTIAKAASVMQPSTALKLSLRVPPTLDSVAAGETLKALLEADPPYGCEVSFDIDFVSPGWHAPATAAWLEASLDEGSRRAFGLPGALVGGGGGIPFLNMLGERFPQTQFVVTGVLGPSSNAHGPNEFLHIPTAQKVTATLAQVLHDAQGLTLGGAGPT